MAISLVLARLEKLKTLVASGEAKRSYLTRREPVTAGDAISRKNNDIDQALGTGDSTYRLLHPEGKESDGEQHGEELAVEG